MAPTPETPPEPLARPLTEPIAWTSDDPHPSGAFAPIGPEPKPSATFNSFLRADTESGAIARHDFGDRIVGEAVFIPRGEGEDEGWLAAFVYDPAAQTSDLALLDAARVEDEPVVLILMP